MIDGPSKTIDINPKHTITAIAMKVWDRATEIGESSKESDDKNSCANESGSTFLGIKLENEKNQEIVKVEWGVNCEDKGRWMYSDVPEG